MVNKLLSLLNAQRYFILAALGSDKPKSEMSLQHVWDVNEQIASLLGVNDDRLKSYDGILKEAVEINELNRLSSL